MKIRIIITIIYIVSCFASINTFANNFSTINIHGNVFDEKTKSSISNADIELLINDVNLSLKNSKEHSIHLSDNSIVKDIFDTFQIDSPNNNKKEKIRTDENGHFSINLQSRDKDISKYSFAIKINKHSYSSIENYRINLVKLNSESIKEDIYYCKTFISMKKVQSYSFWIAGLILLLVYLIIALEKLHRTHAAFLGASILLFISYTIGQFNENFFIISFEQSVSYIDMNVIFLLMAMMIIVGVLKKTGVFQWLALQTFRISRGNIFLLSLIFMFNSAVLSAFLDNVTTVLLMIPISIEISQRLKLNPLTILLPIVFASNVGGTLTLIGDPPNILIGSYSGLAFMDFVKNLYIPVTVSFIASSLFFLYYYKNDYRKTNNMNYESILKTLESECKITDYNVLFYSLIILLVTIFLFIIHGALHMEPSVAALIGASVLLMITKHDIIEMIEKEIEWSSLLFFIFLFIVVGANIETGLIQVIADWIKDLSLSVGPEMAILISMTAILWISGIASAVIDNIPFTATMLPIVAYLTSSLSGIFPEGTNPYIFWWALSLGACFGGNGTIVGASANIVTVGIAEKAGYSISFKQYFKIVFLPTALTMIIAWLWLYIFEM